MYVFLFSSFFFLNIMLEFLYIHFFLNAVPKQALADQKRLTVAYGELLPFRLYTISAILQLSAVFTIPILMRPIRASLRVKALTPSSPTPSSSDTAKKDSDIEKLLSKWEKLNCGRVVLLVLSAMLGFWAAVSTPDYVTLVPESSSIEHST